MTVLEQIEQARANNTPILIKNFINNKFTWDMAIQHLNDELNKDIKDVYKGMHFAVNKKNRIKPIFQTDKFDIQAWNVDIPECEHIRSNMFPHKDPGAGFKLLINFLGDGHKYNIHKDKEEVFSCTLVGSTEYRIYKDKGYAFEEALWQVEGEPYESYIIEAGDVMYMPKGIVHQAIIDNPRVSLIASI